VFTLLIALFYGFVLMQKSFILLVLFPVMIVVLFKKRFIAAFLLCCLSGILLLLSVIITNPRLRGKHDTAKVMVAKRSGNSVNVGAAGIVDRVVFVPGEVAAFWFKSIPSSFPFLEGCGYNFLRPFLNCDYRDYAKELYIAKYPEYSNAGFVGNLNAACFMYDYANFGKKGLIIAGIFTSLLMLFVSALFRGTETGLILAINGFPAILLNSTAYTTMLLSGGWGLLLLLFLLFNQSFIKLDKK